jgi:hypothetical protein
MNEATTRSAIIDPVLDVMGWRPWRCEVPLKEGGKVDYYHDSTRVAIEAKSANPLYDDLAALNPTSAYRNNLEQAVSYLDSTDVWATIFTNARFWWRIERDSASRRLYALRFDLNFAQNVLRNRGAYKPLEHFASFFHANAFRIGANLVLPVHPGRRVNYGPEETVMVKDLNKGLCPSTLDEWPQTCIEFYSSSNERRQLDQARVIVFHVANASTYRPAGHLLRGVGSEEDL